MNRNKRRLLAEFTVFLDEFQSPECRAIAEEDPDGGLAWEEWADKTKPVVLAQFRAFLERLLFGHGEPRAGAGAGDRLSRMAAGRLQVPVGDRASFAGGCSGRPGTTEPGNRRADVAEKTRQNPPLGAHTRGARRALIG